MLGLWCQGISEKLNKKKWQPFSQQFHASILKICRKLMFKFHDGQTFLVFMNKKMFCLKQVFGQKVRKNEINEQKQKQNQI